MRDTSVENSVTSMARDIPGGRPGIKPDCDCDYCIETYTTQVSVVD